MPGVGPPWRGLPVGLEAPTHPGGCHIGVLVRCVVGGQVGPVGGSGRGPVHPVRRTSRTAGASAGRAALRVDGQGRGPPVTRSPPLGVGCGSAVAGRPGPADHPGRPGACRRDQRVTRKGSVELRRALIDLGIGLWHSDAPARAYAAELRIRGNKAASSPEHWRIARTGSRSHASPAPAHHAGRQPRALKSCQLRRLSVRRDLRPYRQSPGRR